MEFGQGNVSGANASSGAASTTQTIPNLNTLPDDQLDPPFRLYPYQASGVEWLADDKTRFKYLADEMGLGKTIQCIFAAQKLRAQKVLILCPAIARFNWRNEIHKFIGREEKVQVLTAHKDIVDFSARWTVCSYDLAGTHKDTLKSCTYDVLICDEAHYLKNPRTYRTRHVIAADGLVHAAARVWAISGTPTPNHVGEMWPWLFTFGLIKKPYLAFLDSFCEGYIYRNERVVTGTKPSMEKEFQDLLAPVFLRRLKKNVLPELPPLIFSHVSVSPCTVDLHTSPILFEYTWPVDRTKELYDKLARQTELLEMNVEQTRFRKEGFAVLSALATSLSTLRMYTGMQKLEAAIEWIKNGFENKAFEKLVVFAVHKDVINNIRMKLPQYNPVTVYGQSNPVTRENNIRRFQTNDATKLIICNIQAAGTAINLTAAHDVLFVETDWVPAYVQQAVMRCHRIGQKEPVSVTFMGLENSIDDKISKAFKRKTEQLTRLYDLEIVAAIVAEEEKLEAERIRGIKKKESEYESDFNIDVQELRRAVSLREDEDILS
jgi:SNF2 family DNA or RNA helicase